MSQQNTRKWRIERLGKHTASRTADVVAKTKNGWGATRRNYQAELVVERITGMPQDSYVSAAMKYGIETEPAGKAAYSFRTGYEIVNVGFIPHPTIPMSGASPDGLIGEHGLVEMKCPNSATHIETLINGGFPEAYYHQVQWQMACTSRRWCDLVSFDLRMPERMQLCIERVNRDERWISDLSREIVIFLAEVDDMVGQLLKKFPHTELAVDATPQPRKHQSWHELSPPQQAGILCADDRFQEFMRHVGYGDCTDEDSTAQRLREILGVESRADIEGGSTADLLLRGLVMDYRAWAP